MKQIVRVGLDKSTHTSWVERGIIGSQRESGDFECRNNNFVNSVVYQKCNGNFPIRESTLSIKRHAVFRIKLVNL